jgi:hypothetical protein
MALWQEIRAIEDPEVRRGLLARIAKTMAGMYAKDIDGATTAGRRSRVFAICLGEYPAARSSRDLRVIEPGSPTMSTTSRVAGTVIHFSSTSSLAMGAA